MKFDILEFLNKYGLTKTIGSVLGGFVITILLPQSLIYFIGSKFSNIYIWQSLISTIAIAIIIFILLSFLYPFAEMKIKINNLFNNLTVQKAKLILFFYEENMRRFVDVKELHFNFYDDYIGMVNYMREIGLLRVVETGYSREIILYLDPRFYKELKKKEDKDLYKILHMIVSPFGF
jgi:hypothetical protein